MHDEPASTAHRPDVPLREERRLRKRSSPVRARLTIGRASKRRAGSPRKSCLVVWRRGCSAAFANALVEREPTQAVVFEGLGRELEVVRALAGVESLDTFAEKFVSLLEHDFAEGDEFRVFDQRDQVRRMSWREFLSTNAEGRFAYCETASTDPQHGRGEFLLQALRPGALSPRPLVASCPEERCFKTRCYLSLMGMPGGYHKEPRASAEMGHCGATEDTEAALASGQPQLELGTMEVEWHYDGFDQASTARLGRWAPRSCA